MKYEYEFYYGVFNTDDILLARHKTYKECVDYILALKDRYSKVGQRVTVDVNGEIVKLNGLLYICKIKHTIMECRDSNFNPTSDEKFIKITKKYYYKL